MTESAAESPYSWRTDYQLVGAGLAAALLLAAALGEYSHALYTFLRIYVTLAAAILGWRAHRDGKVITAVASGVVAILFNPILPIDLERDTWQPIDIIIAGWFTWVAMERLAAAKERPFLRYALIAAGMGLVALLLLVELSNRARPPIDEPSAPVDFSTNELAAPIENVVSARPPEQRLADAFQAATGHSGEFTEAKGADIIITKPLQVVDLPFGPALFVRREIKDGCHACTGSIGIFYLKEAGDRTTVTGSWPNAVEGWGWGVAPAEWRLTDAFTTNPAIYASGSYMGQGIVMESATLTELTPAGPVTSEVIGTGFSDENNIVDESRSACVVKGVIHNIRKDRSFEVNVTGSVTAVDRYAKKNGRFVPVKKIDWGIPCAGEEG